MDPRHWQKVKSLFAEIVDLSSAEQQQYLRQHCVDELLRQDVLQLIKAETAQTKGLATIVLESVGDLAVEQTQLKPGDQLGPYEIESEIGHGGMGIVYLARRIDKQFDQKVAIKLSRQSLQNNYLSTQLVLERQLLGQLEHPNIARIYDAGISADDHPYMVMEYVEGQPIDIYCAEKTTTLDQSLNLLNSVCKAIAYAHQKGIIHRDLKPANILISEVDGKAFPKIIDFGIALSETSTIDNRLNDHDKIEPAFGTPLYMSPEQFKHTEVSAQSDVYSLGLVMYQILCGGLPFQKMDGNIVQIGQQKQHAIQKPNDFLQQLNSKQSSSHTIPNELGAIIVKACAVDAQDRYQTVNELINDIRCYHQNYPISALPNSKFYRLRMWVLRHRFFVIGVLLITWSLIVTVVVSTNSINEQANARQKTQFDFLHRQS